MLLGGQYEQARNTFGGSSGIERPGSNYLQSLHYIGWQMVYGW